MNKKELSARNATPTEPRNLSGADRLQCHDSLKLENQFCHRLYVVSNAITRAYRPFLVEIGLTYPQYVVMMGLWEQDALEVCQLQQRTLIDSGALTLILKKLVDKGFIALAASEADKRRKIISLTELGKDLHERALQAPSRLGCHEISLSNAEQKTLKTLMDRLKSDLLSDCEQPDNKHDC